ncbi:restriction endonuclease subunit S [Chitinispirillales bacterium ANBcel5]|uniref:restriction endonuclease subunit S n=1 Tax=Cellulosispirillum alkaliphilum TaxID=3039283 RepID=UPI002A51F79C|nr:restriction endonuclease subunit S [Chitinispirillales bacterium ANBcel5]
MREDWENILYKDAVFKVSTTKHKLKQKEYLNSGRYPVVDQGQSIIGGYTNDREKLLDCKLPVVVFGDHTKKIKHINFQFAPGADGTKILEPKNGIHPKYISLLTEILVFKIKDKGYARHYQHIEKEYLPLAPLPIQRAIVTKIENLFASLDKGIADLKKAQEQLKVYRQAVLKKAFEGDRFFKLKIEEITEKVQIGPFGSQLHKSDYIKNGVPLINPMHIIDGKILPRFDFSITMEKRNQLPNYILETGDVIIGRRGEMGRCALVTDKENGWFCGTGSLFLRPVKSKIYSPFLSCYLGSPIVKEYLTGSATGTTMMNLNKKIIQNVPIPVPSISEQKQIIKEIESRLSVCDKVEQSINEGLEKCEALRQSILKKAFEGKLLTEKEIEKCKQEADYEPASVLLEKIKKEKKNR